MPPIIVLFYPYCRGLADRRISRVESLRLLVHGACSKHRSSLESLRRALVAGLQGSFVWSSFPRSTLAVADRCGVLEASMVFEAVATSLQRSSRSLHFSHGSLAIADFVPCSKYQCSLKPLRRLGDMHRRRGSVCRVKRSIRGRTSAAVLIGQLVFLVKTTILEYLGAAM